MMQIVPLQPVPSQVLSIILGGQVCQIAIYQKGVWVFCDVSVDDVMVIGGVLCHNRCRIVRAMAGFSGDLTFLDTQGADDPVYTGFGSRFSLAYLTAAEVEGLG